VPVPQTRDHSAAKSGLAAQPPETEAGETTGEGSDLQEANAMDTTTAEGFMRLTWMLVLGIPAVVAVLHIPLAVEWMLRLGQGSGGTRQAPAR
jgi:hypothetical protein